jgi:hypothetical protein
MMKTLLKFIGVAAVVGLAAFAVITAAGSVGMLIESQVHQHPVAEINAVQSMAVGWLLLSGILAALATGIARWLRFKVRKALPVSVLKAGLEEVNRG